MHGSHCTLRSIARAGRRGQGRQQRQGPVPVSGGWCGNVPVGAAGKGRHCTDPFPALYSLTRGLLPFSLRPSLLYGL